QGRVMTRERTEADLIALKRANVNAIRTSHYPNNSFLYELCDRYGFYVIDETNLETHSMWDQILQGQLELADSIPGDQPQWLEAVLDRARSMYERDKNHP
ncbi:Beta-galactosidase, partial [human gut metagenome]